MALNVFKKAAKKTTTKVKKDGPPEITVTDDTEKRAIMEWLDGKKEKASGDTKIKKSEGLLLDKATSLHSAQCQQDDKYYSSIKLVNEDNDKKVTFSFTNKYSAINPENEDELKETFGEENYAKFFEEHTVATLTKSAMNDENLLKI